MNIENSDNSYIYIILHDWAFCNSCGESGAEVEFVTTSESRAINKLKEIKDKVRNELTQSCGFKIYTDTDYGFDTGKDGYYCVEHETWRINKHKYGI